MATAGDGPSRLCSVRSKTKPLRAVPQPLTGGQLWKWAVDFEPIFGVDLRAWIQEWLQKFNVRTHVSEWSIGDVTDCMAWMAAKLDEMGLLDIPDEARAQMQARVESCRPRDPQKPAPGHLTLQPRDPLIKKKRDIVITVKALYHAEHRRDPTESEAWHYLLGRCKAHKIVEPPSLRNLHVPEHVHLIHQAVLADFRDMKLF